MKWIAIREAAHRSRVTLERFPFVLLAGLTCAVFGVQAVEDSGDDTWMRPLLSATIGLPLLFALTISAERRRWTPAWRAGAGLLGIALVIGFWWGTRGWSDMQMAARYVQINLASHLLASFLPFVGAGTMNGFWQYNRSLFLRFLLAGLYAAVLFAGLALALLAIDNLLGIDVSDESYGRLWMLLAFVFQPWLFLAGVPADLEALDRLEEYPAGLKVFTQFVLIPLVSVYLMILTAYLVRILVTQTWPSGWIGWLVSGVAAVGTLALLLVHPIRERADSRWVDAYGRWFYVALLPSIAMLLMAIWQRIDQYSFTENRYFLLVGSVWLAGIALYYGVTGSRNIRVIPLTLCVVTLLTFAGPWSAYAVSSRSQIGRLRAILRSNEMLADGQLQRPPAQVSVEDRRELSAILRYLIDTHGQQTLARIDRTLADTTAAGESLAAAEDTDHEAAARAMRRLGLAYVNRREGGAGGQFFHLAEPGGPAVDVTGFETLRHVNLMQRTAIAIGEDSLVLGPIEGIAVPLLWQGSPAGTVLLESVIAGLGPGTPRPAGAVEAQPAIVLDADAGGIRLRLVISQITGTRTDSATTITAASADLLIGRR